MDPSVVLEHSPNALIVKFPVKSGINMSHMIVHITATQLVVGIKGRKAVLRGTLKHTIEPSNCVAKIQNNTFILTIPSKLNWSTLFQEEAAPSGRYIRHVVCIDDTVQPDGTLFLKCMIGDVYGVLVDDAGDGNLKCEELFASGPVEAALVVPTAVRDCTPKEDAYIAKHNVKHRLTAWATVNEQRKLFVHFEHETLFLFTKEVDSMSAALLAQCPAKAQRKLLPESRLKRSSTNNKTLIIKLSTTKRITLKFNSELTASRWQEALQQTIQTLVWLPKFRKSMLEQQSHTSVSSNDDAPPAPPVAPSPTQPTPPPTPPFSDQPKSPSAPPEPVDRGDTPPPVPPSLPSDASMSNIEKQKFEQLRSLLLSKLQRRQKAVQRRLLDDSDDTDDRKLLLCSALAPAVRMLASDLCVTPEHLTLESVQQRLSSHPRLDQLKEHMLVLFDYQLGVLINKVAHCNNVPQLRKLVALTGPVLDQASSAGLAVPSDQRTAARIDQAQKMSALRRTNSVSVKQTASQPGSPERIHRHTSSTNNSPDGKVLTPTSSPMRTNDAQQINSSKLARRNIGGTTARVARTPRLRGEASPSMSPANSPRRAMNPKTKAEKIAVINEIAALQTKTKNNTASDAEKRRLKELRKSLFELNLDGVKHDRKVRSSLDLADSKMKKDIVLDDEAYNQLQGEVELLAARLAALESQPNTNNTAINTLRERLDAAREAARVAHETRQLSHSGKAKKNVRRTLAAAADAAAEAEAAAAVEAAFTEVLKSPQGSPTNSPFTSPVSSPRLMRRVNTTGLTAKQRRSMLNERNNSPRRLAKDKSVKEEKTLEKQMSNVELQLKAIQKLCDAEKADLDALRANKEREQKAYDQLRADRKAEAKQLKLMKQELQKLSGDVQKVKKLQASGSNKRKKDRKTTIVDRLGTKSAIAKVTDASLSKATSSEVMSSDVKKLQNDYDEAEMRRSVLRATMDDIEASIGNQPKDKETLNILMQLGLEVADLDTKLENLKRRIEDKNAHKSSPLSNNNSKDQAWKASSPPRGRKVTKSKSASAGHIDEEEVEKKFRDLLDTVRHNHELLRKLVGILTGYLPQLTRTESQKPGIAAKARSNFQATDDEELSVQKGEPLIVLTRQLQATWLVCQNVAGARGRLPKSVVKILTMAHPASPESESESESDEFDEETEVVVVDDAIDMNIADSSDESDAPLPAIDLDADDDNDVIVTVKKTSQYGQLPKTANQLQDSDGAPDLPAVPSPSVSKDELVKIASVKK